MKKLPALLPFLLLSYFSGNCHSQATNNHARQAAPYGQANKPSTLIQIMRMNLYAFKTDGSTFIVDGTATQYDDSFSNSIDGFDARKMSNPGENVSLLRGTTNLVIERRQTIGVTDTIFFRMWGLQKKAYEMRFDASNLNHTGLSAYLEDSYLHSSAPIALNDSTRIFITINNDAASYAPNRFRLIYKNTDLFTAMPLEFTVVNAQQQNEQVHVNWKTVNEKIMKQYVVERSADGVVFTDMAVINAYNLSPDPYTWTDYHPLNENNYYRIRNEGPDGANQYSNVVEVKLTVAVKRDEPGKAIDGTGSISLFPNPVVGHTLNLKIANQQAGIYKISIINSYGVSLLLQSFTYSGGNSIEKLSVTTNIPKGIYRLEITKPDGRKHVIPLVF